ncbi:tripartite tricarboxylate transporter TctB family protein [Mangrovicella endophytica]|uniref:tripartite tricarboxylate transporter TctB family protein n=1 Tax=Mangrovicella endophytica TaxID=2066697 RepID=UPI001300149C|nr:tripartite tricarboxylate transporter TctB family protein [Mangrovicella endophytica]
MNIRLNRDLVSGGVFVAAGAAFAVTASGYDIGSASEMGTGYFPLCIGILLAVLGVFVIAQALRSDIGAESVNLRLRAVLLILASLLAFYVLLPILGLPLSTFITFVIAAKADPETPLTQIVAAGAGLAIIAYLLFVVALGLPIQAFPALLS